MMKEAGKDDGRKRDDNQNEKAEGTNKEPLHKPRTATMQLQQEPGKRPLESKADEHDPVRETVGSTVEKEEKQTGWVRLRRERVSRGARGSERLG